MMLLAALPLLPPALILAGVLLYARRQSLDNVTQLLMLLALAFYYFHFYHTTYLQFSIDPEPHMSYVRFLLDSHRLPRPEDNMGAAARHPPAFYIATAAMLGSAEALQLSNPEQFARHVAMACYMVFILTSAGLLRQLLPARTMAYYSALLMLLFWPIGITIGGRISCDVWLYMGQAGCLYAMTRWFADRTPDRLAAPFMWGGVAVMGKNSGYIMIGFAGYALLKTAWAERRNLRVLLRSDLIAAILFALVCAVFSFWHGWILRHIEMYGYYWGYLYSRIDSFNPFLFIYDTALGLSQDSFWNMWLHTLLMGDGSMRWNYPSLVLVSKVIWLSLLFYAAEGLIAARKTLTPLEKSTLQMLVVFIILMMGAMLYLLMRTANSNYMDARYAYPSMIIFALMHGIVMKHHLAAGRMVGYRMGGLLSVSFVSVTMALFITQYLA